MVGRSLSELGLPPALVEAASGERGADEVYVTGDHVLVASTSTAFWEGREVGAVVTLRDHTELQSLTGELDVVRGLTESLRAQTHEAANRLHTVVSLIEMGRPEQAVEFVTGELQVAQMLTDQVVGAVAEPVVAALLLGKTAEASERGVQLTVTGELPAGDLAAGESEISTRDLVTVLGNLVDNALDAVAGRADRRIVVHLEGSDRPRPRRGRRQRPRAHARGGGPRARARLDHQGRHRRRQRGGPRPRLAGRPPPRRQRHHRPLAPGRGRASPSSSGSAS